MILRRICQLSLTRITHQVSRAFDLNVKGDICCPDISFLNFTSHFASIIHELKSRNALGILSHCTGGLFYIMNEIDCADQNIFSRGTGSASCYYNEQLRCRTNALFRFRNFRYFQCSLRIFRSISFSFSWHLDLYLSGYSDCITDDPTKTFCDRIPAEFCSRFCFSMMLDVHKGWISILPYNIPMRIIYFCISYLLLCLGIALSNRCGLPIIPTDLFPRELSPSKL